MLAVIRQRGRLLAPQREAAGLAVLFLLVRCLLFGMHGGRKQTIFLGSGMAREGC